MSTSHAVCDGFTSRPRDTKDLHKYGTNCPLLGTQALIEFDSVARLFKRLGSVCGDMQLKDLESIVQVLHGLQCQKAI